MAEARPQGTASTLRELFRRRLQVARTARTGYAGCSSPGVLLRPGSTGSLEQDYKTQNEFNGGRTQGGSNEIKAEGGMNSETLPELGE